jgi:leucyl-tRNA synthetase
MLKITAYADRLEQDLAGVDWPDGTLRMQKEWIGRSEGAEIHFGVDGHEGARIAVFTTRPDTLMGVTYVVLAPEHPLVATITKGTQQAEVQAYVKKTASRSDRDRIAQTKQKTGVATGAFAVHPISGAKVPIWVADYVIGSYGTGAVMAVPGHDTRDFEFAKAFGLAIVEVVSPDGALHGELTEAFVDEGVAVQSGEFDGLSTADCKRKIVDALAARDRGSRKITYKLRDWVFSRQRYWGEPIPIYFPVDLPEGGDPRQGAKAIVRFDQPIAVKEEELPLRLPDLADFRPGDDPAGPLARALDWRFFEKDGRFYARETNTMPQWAGSCWYYLRFLDPKNQEAAFSKAAYDAWMPVDLYVGGAEHAVLHLLYARFWHKVLFDEGVVTHTEPFAKLVHQGMILGEDNEKMSKSRGNVVNPDDIVQAHGADCLRLYEMFMGPLEATKPWQSSQIQGVVRFRDRAFALVHKPTTDELDAETSRLMHRTIKKVGDDVEALSFNTAISAMMVFVNHLSGLPAVPRRALRALTLVLAPFAPHVAEEMWHLTGHDGFVARAEWPTFDPAETVDDVIEMAVQVNGKVRGRVKLAKDAAEADARAAALAADGVEPFVAGKPVKKFIYVPGKIINLVV